MKKIIVSGIILIIVIVLFYRREDSGTITDFFAGASINQIIIEAGDHPVLLQNAEAEEITISLDKCNKEISSIKNQTLTLQPPAAKAGINIKKPSTLAVMIPKDWLGSVDICSEAGNIKVDKVVLTQLKIKSDYGNVSCSGLSGFVSAKSNMGEIVVPENLADQVKPGDMDLGAAFEASIGDAEGTDNDINIYTDTGSIKID